MDYEHQLSEIYTSSLPRWLHSMKDSEFYTYRMCASSYHSRSCDAHTLACDLLQMLGSAPSEAALNQLRVELDRYQTGQEGFFFELFATEELKNHTEKRVLEMHGNYLTFQACGAYRGLGLKLRKVVTFYDQFIQGKGLRAYLSENLPWNKSPWGAGGMVDNLCTIFHMNIELGRAEYEEQIEIIFKWLNENQSPVTGLWGSIDTQGINGIINGGYHLMRGSYFLYVRPIQYPEKIIDTIIDNINSHPLFKDTTAHGCHDLDHFYLLERCHQRCQTYRVAEIRAIAEKRLSALLNLIPCSDGGLSFEAENAVKSHNYISVSPGIKEGDMQGAVFYLQTFISLARILRLNVCFKEQQSSTHG